MIIIIGRGHSGTRAISHTLYASGVYMGACLNASGDLVPAQPLYDACRIFGKHVKWSGGHAWDWSGAVNAEIDPEWNRLVDAYLGRVLTQPDPLRGWKLPETTLVYPWIVRRFPDAQYIFWVRDPYDCILGAHLTDDLPEFGAPAPETEDEIERRAISWLYQYRIVKSVPLPEKRILVRFEDFVLRQDETLERLEHFLGIPLGRIIVRPETVGRWERSGEARRFGLLDEACREFGYACSEAENAGRLESGGAGG